MQIQDINHVVVGGGKHLVCHWPRQGGLWRWGDEWLVGYIESPCDYRNESEVGHGQSGIWERGYVRLRRSMDGGHVWEDDGILFNNALSVGEQRDVLRLDAYQNDGGRSLQRKSMDLSDPNTVLMMGRAWCGDEVDGGEIPIRKNIAYCYRSTDRGKSWEDTPSIIWPNHTDTVVELANNMLRLNDGRLICWVVGFGGVEGAAKLGGQTYSPQLYASDDQGITWQFYSEIYCDPHNRIAASYPHIIPLPSGRWLCVLGCWFQAGGARVRWTSVCFSDDQGLNWSAPRRIHAWSISPYPVLLNDGRLIIVYMRRNPDPTGLYAIISEDEGQSWSNPLCIRNDTISAGPRGVVDGGYPLALQCDDGRIFTAYYWQHDDQDVPWHGGRKFIAGTYFRI